MTQIDSTKPKSTNSAREATQARKETGETTTFHFVISTKRIMLVLVAGTAIVVTLSTIGHLIQQIFNLPRDAQVARIFNLGGEANVASWFNSALLFISAALLFYVANVRKNSERRHWWWLGIIFVFLSIDETAVLHDVTLERPLVEWLEPSGFLSFPWVIFGWLFVLLLAIPYWPFVRKLPDEVRQLLLLSAGLYVGGALILEMYSAWLFDLHPTSLILRGVIGIFQEVGELSGILLFIYGLFRYIDLCQQSKQLD